MIIGLKTQGKKLGFKPATGVSHNYYFIRVGSRTLAGQLEGVRRRCIRKAELKGGRIARG